MVTVCNQDCFHCPYPDCILEKVPEKDAEAESTLIDRVAPDAKDRAKRERYRAYYARNSERCIKYAKAYYQKHRESERARKHELYKRRHPGASDRENDWSKLYKPVVATDKDGNETWYPSISAAAKELHIVISSISRVCLKMEHYKTAGGYKWRYADAK